MSALTPLTPEELSRMDAYWRAANYLAVGQIYLLDNPLLREPLKAEHVKPRLLGHWGTTPGLNFLYLHLNRLIRARDLNLIFIAGPGHGGPALTANTWLEGSYSELYPDVSADAEGMRRLFKQFSFPGGVGSHATPETPGSIHEGGELGYALSHAYGAAFDNPDLVACCVVGDGEAETGPLATAWHSNKFLNPGSDGAVLPILHLNGYKIANPSVLARIPEAELESLLRGYGYAPRFVSGDDPATMHQLMAATLDAVFDEIAAIQAAARGGNTGRPLWPMIVLRTPKGWTGPKEVDGLPTEGTWRSHQVPLSGLHDNPAHLAQLEQWLRGYRDVAEGVGEWAFYAVLVLMIVALVKRIPYRWFAKTHQLIAIAYLALVFHALVLLKWAYWSQPVGWLVALLLLAGTVSALGLLSGYIKRSRTVAGEVADVQYFAPLRVTRTTLTMAPGWPGHAAGQFAFVTSDPHEGAHPYTIASAWDPARRRITFITKALGDYTENLHEKLRPGQPVQVEGPYGCFTFDDGAPRQIWVGGGIGITPFIARMEQLASQGASGGARVPVTLFHTTREEDPEALARLQADARAAGIELQVLVDAKDGFLSGERIRAAVPQWREASFWFCGPTGFGEALRRDFIAQGLPASRWHQELFEMR